MKLRKAEKSLWLVIFVSASLGLLSGFLYLKHLPIACEDQVRLDDLVRFDDLTHDFGRVSSGTVVTHAFHFTNKGARDIRIRKIISSCGCMATQSTGKVVVPGESDTLLVNLSTRGVNASTDLRKAIKIEFEPSSIPSVTLTVLAQIGANIVTDPGKIYFTLNNDGASDDAHLDIKRDLLPRKFFSGIQLKHAAYYEVRRMSTDADKLSISVRLLKNYPDLPAPLEVVYFTSDTEVQRTLIPVKIEWCRDIRIAPRSYFLLFDPTRNEDLQVASRRRFLLISKKPHNLVIKKIILENEALDQVLAWRIDGNTANPGFVVWIKSPPPTDLLSATLRVFWEDMISSASGHLPLDVRVVRVRATERPSD